MFHFGETRKVKDIQAEDISLTNVAH